MVANPAKPEKKIAQQVGSRPLGLLSFQAGAFNHSAISPSFVYYFL
jgi:hypothetical protein